jgi:hypothetical protein
VEGTLMRLAVRLAVLALLTILSGPVAFAQTVLSDGTSIRLLDVLLDVVNVPPSPGPLKITQQIRFGGRVLLQAEHPLTIVARAGSEAAELVVLKVGAGMEFHVIAVRKDQPPETWRVYGEQSIEPVHEGLVLAGKPHVDGSRTRIQWTATKGWSVLERAHEVEPLEEPRSVVEAHRSMPALVDRCAEPPSLAETVCRNPEFQESEAEVQQALAELLPTLTDDERPLVIEELLQLRRKFPQSRSNAAWQTNDNKKAAELYHALAHDEAMLFGGGKPERDHRTIKVGHYELVESWLPDENGTLQRVLHLGTSVAIASGDIAHFETFGEGDIGDTHVVLVNSPEAGTARCHKEYLLADTPGHPLRVWTLPNRRGCNSEGLEATPATTGYELTMRPHPARDGVLYRWTPADGLTVVAPLPYRPAADDVLYPAMQRFTGPSANGLALFLDFHTEQRESGNSDFELTIGCEGPAWACGYRPGYLRALRQRSTGAFYLATYGLFDERRACGEWDARRQPTAEDLRELPIEYHPPAESWPREALEVLRTSFCSKE